MDAQTMQAQQDADRDHATSTEARSDIVRLAELARRGSLDAGRELIRRAIAECDRSEELRDPDLSEWLKDFLSGAFTHPRRSVGQLLGTPGNHLHQERAAESTRSRFFGQEIYSRVRAALKAGRPRKRAFNDVARDLNALGYRNSKNEQLRAASIERQYYEVRRRKIALADRTQREHRKRTR